MILLYCTNSLQTERNVNKFLHDTVFVLIDCSAVPFNLLTMKKVVSQVCSWNIYKNQCLILEYEGSKILLSMVILRNRPPFQKPVSKARKITTELHENERIMVKMFYSSSTNSSIVFQNASRTTVILLSYLVICVCWLWSILSYHTLIFPKAILN